MAVSRPKMKRLTDGLTLFSLFLLPFAMAGSSDSDSNNHYNNISPSLAAIIVVLVVSLFLMGLLAVYFRHCSRWSAGNVGPNWPNFSIRSRRGLDPAVIETFPTFAYSEVKGLKIGKGVLECAVCLNEFQDDETLRLLPKCDHVFHPECIDAWLESNVTCPVCRANLAPDSGESTHFPAAEAQLAEAEMGAQAQKADIDNQQNGDVSIRICQENQQQVAPAMTTRSSSVGPVQARPPRSRSVRQPFGRFRSNSTGHSLVQPGENMDRFTLRLPEGVRKEVINRGLLNRTGSCVVAIGESGSSRGYRPGEGTTRSRIFSIFTRAPSMRSPKVGKENGEGSTSAKTPKGVVKMPSFKCLEPKADDTIPLSDDSAMHPV